MASRIGKFLLFVLGQVPTLLVLAALAGLAVWGAERGWKIAPRTPVVAKSEEKKEDKDEKGALTISEEARQKAGIEVEPVRSQTLSEYVQAPGVLAFDQDRYAQLSTRARRAAWRVPRRVGDQVKKGDVLFIVTSAEVGKVKADVLQALVQVEVKAKALQRLESASDSVPERQIFDARTALREARIRRLADQQALANLGLPLGLDEVRGLSDEQMARHLRLLGLPSDIVPPQEVERLPANLLPLRAPFAGVIVNRNVVVGEVVTPDRPQFVLADPRWLWVMLDVRLEDMSRLAIGQEVTFRSAPTGQTATGKMTWIAAEIDPKTRTVRARAELPNPGGRLRPGTFGSVRVLVRTTEEAVAVPDEAVQWDGRAHRVFVRTDEKTYHPRLVVPGTRSGGQTELLSPNLLLATSTLGLLSAGPLEAASLLPASTEVLERVRPGDKVVTVGSHVLKSEMLKDRIGDSE